MSDTIIKIENLSKKYRLGVVGTRTLTGDVQRWVARIRGKEDPFLKIGEENELNSRSGEYVWALRDINLEVKRGEVLGIIGKNGAGKSTLLKILSRVTGPTTGSIKTRGRIASLLEVGTGFHPELTGRENIFLNGAILGMSRQEVRAKLNEIVAFAGVEKYLDTPVKRYSSGMYVRLAFAVAAHLEPDILVVDEVLAVGDAEFQKKAIGKMQDVSRMEGRTVLFVSHNMGSIRNLCKRSILLQNGKFVFQGTSDEVVDKYLSNQSAYRTAGIKDITERRGNGLLRFKNVELKTKDKKSRTDFFIGEPLYIEVDFEKSIEDKDIFSSRIDVMINDKNSDVVTWISTSIYELNCLNGKNTVIFYIERLMVNHGKYDLTLYSEINGILADRVQNVKGLTVLFNDYYRTGKEINSGQCCLVSDFRIM